MSTIGRMRISARLKSILGGLLLVFLTSCLPPNGGGGSKTPESDSFVYQVQVSDGAKVIPQAQVQISIRNSNLRPLIKLVDANGNAVFDIPANYRNQAGLLQVSASGYAPYDQNVNVTPDLPTQIILRKPTPPTTPVSVLGGGDGSADQTPVGTSTQPPPLPPSGCAPDIQLITFNQPVSGKIASGQVKKYCFSAESNKPVIFNASSSMIQILVEILDSQGVGVLYKMYYSPGERNPGKAWTPQSSGAYVLRVTGLDSGYAGSFAVTLSHYE
jgi:hypothetical protein